MYSVTFHRCVALLNLDSNIVVHMASWTLAKSLKRTPRQQASNYHHPYISAHNVANQNHFFTYAFKCHEIIIWNITQGRYVAYRHSGNIVDNGVVNNGAFRGETLCVFNEVEKWPWRSCATDAHLACFYFRLFLEKLKCNLCGGQLTVEGNPLFTD